MKHNRLATDGEILEVTLMTDGKLATQARKSYEHIEAHETFAHP